LHAGAATRPPADAGRAISNGGCRIPAMRRFEPGRAWRRWIASQVRCTADPQSPAPSWTERFEQTIFIKV